MNAPLHQLNLQLALIFFGQCDAYTELNSNNKYSSMSQLNCCPIANDIDQIIDEELITQQNHLIAVLKQQIIRLQNDANYHAIQKSNLANELDKAYRQIEFLQQKIKLISQNNQSLLQTVNVFQREFIKRDSNQALRKLPVQSNRPANGPFHLEIIRTLKSKFINHNIEPSEVASGRSAISEFYGYFLQEPSVQESEVTLYNEIVEERKQVRSSKIRSLGKKSFFNEKFRHVFWFNCIQNKLKITHKLYDQFVEIYENNRQNKPLKTSIIDLDLRRMDIKLDEEKSKIVLTEVKKLLEIFCIYRPDIKYVQGMSYLAWILLIRLNGYQSFVCFCNLILGDPFINSLYMFEEMKIKSIVAFFSQCLEDKKPKLAKHMKNLCVEPQLFLIQWAYTFYSRTFSLRLVSKIWDLWLSQGFNAFFKVAMTVFQILEPELLEVNQNDKFVEVIRTNSFKVQEKQFLKLLCKQKLFQDLKLD